MSLQRFFHCQMVGDKAVYTVDEHHKALAAWAMIRRGLDEAPNLVTIDHHTDTHEAFLGHASTEFFERRIADPDVLRSQLIQRINWRDDASVGGAIAKLRHDEHIHAATMSGTLADAFCIQLSDNRATQSIEQLAYSESCQKNWPNPPAFPEPRRPMTYTASSDRVYVIPFDCYIGCQAMPHNGNCRLRQAGEIIESTYLEDQLARGAEIGRCIGLPDLEAKPYVLDIDLDVFHTRKAIRPDDPSTFYRLIRNALAITVATEAACVEELWLDESDRMDARGLLGELLTHIATAA